MLGREMQIWGAECQKRQGGSALKAPEFYFVGLGVSFVRTLLHVMLTHFFFFKPGSHTDQASLKLSM